MKIWCIHKSNRPSEEGAVAVFVAVILAMLVGFAALAVDVGHLYGVRNELKNGADAGSLAGARKLHNGNCDELEVSAAKEEAERVAKLNTTGNEMVQVDKVETGHWSFATGKFTESPNTTQPTGWQEITFSALDQNLEYINAVQVTTKRPETPSFLARIFGIDKFFLSAKAVAYIGFAGSVPPHTSDEPLALCKQFVKQGDHYSCSVGRMISENDETGGWTNFSQECSPSNPGSLNPLMCGAGNPVDLVFGKEISTNNGMIESVFDNFKNNCWNKTENPRTTPLNATLPVVDCQSGGFSQPCVEKVVGVVNVDIIWVQRNQKDPAPRKMWNTSKGSFWTCAAGMSETACWNSFVTEFNLQDIHSSPAPLTKKTLYFLPNCEFHPPIGTTGGQNFGICAEIPVLVQ